jgi:hypothetical protein
MGPGGGRPVVDRARTDAAEADVSRSVRLAWCILGCTTRSHIGWKDSPGTQLWEDRVASPFPPRLPWSGSDPGHAAEIGQVGGFQTQVDPGVELGEVGRGFNAGL